MSASTKKKALGRGLGALLSAPPAPATENKAPIPTPIHHTVTSINTGIHINGVTELPIDQIKPNRFQPRKEFKDELLDDLSLSIKEKGVITPILVRRALRGYEIIAGERRFRASQKAGLKSIPALIKDVSDEESLEIAIIENIQRQDLNPIEEAKAYRQLAEQFEMTHEQVAQKVGKERSSVTNTLRLLDLPDEVQKEVLDGNLTMGHARCILGLETPQQMLDSAKLFISKGLSVRQAEAYIQKIKAPKTGKTIDPAKDSDIYARDLENKLRQSLGTKVKVQPKGNGGQIIIDFADLDELDRLLLILNKA
jgi:ParB family chromosome partitioning protein